MPVFSACSILLPLVIMYLLKCCKHLFCHVPKPSQHIPFRIALFLFLSRPVPLSQLPKLHQRPGEARREFSQRRLVVQPAPLLFLFTRISGVQPVTPSQPHQIYYHNISPPLSTLPIDPCRHHLSSTNTSPLHFTHTRTPLDRTTVKHVLSRGTHTPTARYRASFSSTRS